MNGKGSKRRQGANDEAYYSNYDRIFRKKKEETLSEEDEEKFENDKLSMSYSEIQKILKRNDNQ